MSPLAVLGAALIGLSLGITGAGGSIITLPVLVYLAGVAPQEAVGLSLFIVGTAASVGALIRLKAKELHAPAVMMFAVSGMAGAAMGSRLTHLVSPQTLMIVFAVTMLIVAVNMLRGAKGGESVAADCRPVRCLAAGAAVGVMTGFIGVGGGFLLVPALIRFARLPLAMATGTSLAVIGFNSFAGFASHYHATSMPWSLAWIFASVAALGVVIGTKFSQKLPAKITRRGFAALVIVTGVFVLWQNF